MSLYRNGSLLVLSGFSQIDVAASYLYSWFWRCNSFPLVAAILGQPIAGSHADGCSSMDLTVAPPLHYKEFSQYTVESSCCRGQSNLNSRI